MKVFWVMIKKIIYICRYVILTMLFIGLILFLYIMLERYLGISTKLTSLLGKVGKKDALDVILQTVGTFPFYDEISTFVDFIISPDNNAREISISGVLRVINSNAEYTVNSVTKLIICAYIYMLLSRVLGLIHHKMYAPRENIFQSTIQYLLMGFLCLIIATDITNALSSFIERGRNDILTYTVDIISRFTSSMAGFLGTLEIRKIFIEKCLNNILKIRLSKKILDPIFSIISIGITTLINFGVFGLGLTGVLVAIFFTVGIIVITVFITIAPFVLTKFFKIIKDITKDIMKNTFLVCLTAFLFSLSMTLTSFIPKASDMVTVSLRYLIACGIPILGIGIMSRVLFNPRKKTNAA